MFVVVVVLGGHDYPSLDRVVSSLEHQFNFDIIMLIDGIQEIMTLKVIQCLID